MSTLPQYTRCPECHTTFRVTQQQLELREGQVRCGRCRTIFNAYTALFNYKGRRIPGPGMESQTDTMTLRDYVDAEPEDFTIVKRPPHSASSAYGAAASPKDSPAFRDALADLEKRRHQSAPLEKRHDDRSPAERVAYDAKRAQRHAEQSLESVRRELSRIRAESGSEPPRPARQPGAVAYGVAAQAAQSAVHHHHHETPTARPAETTAVSRKPVSAPERHEEHRVERDEDRSERRQNREIRRIKAETEALRKKHHHEEHLEKRAQEFEEEKKNAETPSARALKAEHGKDESKEARRRSGKKRGARVEDELPKPSVSMVFEPERKNWGERIGLPGWVAPAVYSVIALVLALFAWAQFTRDYSDTLAYEYPVMKPAFVHTCAIIGCKIHPYRDLTLNDLSIPASAKKLVIDGSSMEAVPGKPNRYVFSATITNKSSGYSVAFPDIQFELVDNWQQPLIRRYFKPKDYLPNPDDIEKGLGPGRDISIQIPFDTTEENANGYRATLVYR